MSHVVLMVYLTEKHTMIEKRHPGRGENKEYIILFCMMEANCMQTNWMKLPGNIYLVLFYG